MLWWDRVRSQFLVEIVNATCDSVIVVSVLGDVCIDGLHRLSVQIVELVD